MREGASPCRRPLKVGIFVTALTGRMREGTLRWRDLQALAVRAEAVGFDSFWMPDHLLFKPAGEAPHGPWECWTVLGALAASTSRLELGSLVTCTAFRSPGLIAKMADTVDEISGGRFVLGLGAGWHQPEYEAFGHPFDKRFERFEEAVGIIRTLLRTGRIDHDGPHYSLRACELRPRGPRPQGPPILIGALASRPRMLTIAARHADYWNGWLSMGRSDAGGVGPLREAVDAACAREGRDPATLVRTLGLAVDQRPASARPAEGGTARQALTGSPAELAGALRAVAAEGIVHVQLTLHLEGTAGVEAFAPVLEHLDRGSA